MQFFLITFFLKSMINLSKYKKVTERQKFKCKLGSVAQKSLGSKISSQNFEMYCICNGSLNLSCVSIFCNFPNKLHL